MCYLYILYSKSIDRYYIGITIELETRLSRHNQGGSKYTKRGVPWTLVHTETYDNKSDAMERESYLKKQKSRKLIEKIIRENS